jgi:Domain of unknown function (DUF4276)
MRRIVLFVEGEGESEAAPKLVGRLLNEQNASDAVFLDGNPFRVGGVNKLAKDDYHEWKRLLGACLKRPNVGGVLLLLDGDARLLGTTVFCAREAARAFAGEAKAVVAGKQCSVAVVFARQEYESWLIAGVESSAGKKLPDGRMIRADAKAPDGDLENAPRDAKGWFDGAIEGGYRPTRDQAALTSLVDLSVIRARNMRSFKRLDSAVVELVAAIRAGVPIVSPSR